MKILSIIIIILLSLFAIAFVIAGYYGGALGLLFVNILIYFNLKKDKQKKDV